MKTIFTTLVASIISATAFGAINCTGYNVKAPAEILNLNVDGNPLKIFYKVKNAQNAGMSLLVQVLEKGIIKGESREVNQYSFGTQGELIYSRKGLPQGYNAKFTVRVDPSDRVVSSSIDKTEYMMSCRGNVPSVYADYVK